MQRTLARATRGSNRRGRVKHAIARLRARETDRRKDWAEKVSTGIARRFDVIRIVAGIPRIHQAGEDVKPSVSRARGDWVGAMLDVDAGTNHRHYS